jgi:Flp pilus assembly protein TadG
MMRGFLADRRGNYALMTVIALVPLMGGLAFAVDFAEMTRQKDAVGHALDAAGIATAREIATGAKESELLGYAKTFFEANLGTVNPADTQLSVVLPANQVGGGTLKLSAQLNYKPLFFPVFAGLAGAPETEINADVSFTTRTEIRLKNTLEVALVLDNSGSMDNSTASGLKRIDLLKAAAKELVKTLADQAKLIKQVDKPVQFSLVPFAASVNVGPDNAGADWMDVNGVSPVHQENFDWTTLNEPDKSAEKRGGIWYKKGTGWGEEEDEVLTRFTLYNDMKQVSSREWVVTGQEYICTHHNKKGVCDKGHWQDTGHYDETISGFASWQGCVEARPYPYNTTDAAASSADPASLFVPMFAPDEPGDRWETSPATNLDSLQAVNNWWNDGIEDASGSKRQKNMTKYFDVRPFGATSPQGSGPNYSCTTQPITPLTDVTVPDGLAAINLAIDNMAPNGNTDVPEGMAWGWRTVSSREPFSTGRSESEKGNDKVVIVLTDGANTYGDLSSTDPAGNKSTYAAYGYLQPGYNGSSVGRLLTGTSAGQFDYTSGNYTAALDEHMSTLCDHAKAADVLVITVSLELRTTNTGENKAIQALQKCASDSRFSKDPADPSKPKKLYFNADGSAPPPPGSSLPDNSLAAKFKEIANELSNLRIAS